MTFCASFACKRSLIVPVSRGCFKVFVQLPHGSEIAAAAPAATTAQAETFGAPDRPAALASPLPGAFKTATNTIALISGKLRIFLSDTVHQSWVWWGQLEQHPEEKSWQRRLHRYLQRLMQRIDVDETILRRLGNMSSKGSELVITRPECVSHEEIIDNLCKLKNKKHKHKRMFVASVLLTPITAAMGVLPGPNVFLYWNAYRAWSHYGAMNGSIYLQQLLDREAVITESDESLTEYWRKGVDGLASDSDTVDDHFIRDMTSGLHLDGDFDLFMHQAIYSLSKLKK